MNPRGRTVSSPMMEEELHLVCAPFLFYGSFQDTGRLTFFYYFPEKRTCSPTSGISQFFGISSFEKGGFLQLPLFSLKS